MEVNLEIVEIMIDHFNYKGKINWDTKGYTSDNKLCSNDLFRNHFPSFKFTPLEDGIKETIDFFMEKYNV